MFQEIRCPKCGKLIGKAKKNFKIYGVLLWCPRCKRNIEIQNENDCVITKQCSSSQ